MNITPNDIVVLKDNSVHLITKVSKKGIAESINNDNITLDDIESFKVKKTNKALKFRIYPNKEQIEYINQAVKTSNFIYNTFLRQQQDISDKFTENYLTNSKIFNDYLDTHNINLILDEENNSLIKSFFKFINEDGDIDHLVYYKSLIKDIGEARKIYMKENDLYFNRFKASSELTKIANSKELNDDGNLKYGFIKLVDATMRTYTLKSLDNAFTKIWKTNSGYPKYKNKFSTFSFSGQIFYNNDSPRTFSLLKKSNKITLINIPKLKKIKMICHNKDFIENWNNIDSYKINSYTISKNPKNQYFISLQIITNINNYSIKNFNPSKTIGIDMGVERPITTSNPDEFKKSIFKNRFDILKKYNEERNKLSKILNKKIDYHKKNNTGIKYYETNSYKRIKHKLGIINTKINDVRSNKQHNITSLLTKNEKYNTFVIEDLNISSMTKKSAKGESNKKSNINRVMLDVGLNTIKTQLKYKASQEGKEVVMINPAYTSQTCNSCGNVNKENRKTQSKFICTKCKHEINADLNAAINIKNSYLNS